ncbi:MAG: hypothetical protein M1824_004433 [Vezdaea acicularis]|nr:MAG: hypothetical protein M1824_004433 [Vezdaea acicularis]
MASSYALLDPADEDALHKPRLLVVEEKPFKRITKRLLGPESLITSHSKLPTPPPDGESEDTRSKSEQFREAVAFDFAAFDSSVARMQFIQTSNSQERDRYAAERLKILDTSNSVRESTADLRLQLEKAQETLAIRKGWDELTEKITNNRMLRTREDQRVNLEKLNVEIADLEQESSDYAEVWTERREQFGRIVKEGMELRRLIRDEKEEVERREGMDVDASITGKEDGEEDEKEEGEEDEGDKMDIT